ncbi:MAG TPA: RluA family pseudouridine synthase [Solirubrobacteraceae bacterium]|nr:RluA family pseudouridine synthase [Solirubrobacteraceae bacterium]
MTEPPLTLTVGEEAAGMRLDRFLSAPLGSRAQAQAAIDAGQVRVDGQTRRKRHHVAAGEAITVDPAGARPEAPGAPSVEFRIAYEDGYLLVVDKPAGLVVHPARGHRSGTLAQALTGRAAGGEDGQRPGIVHRLDRDTSGLLVVAKSDDVHRRLKELLADRRLRREYISLVAGRPAARTGTIDAPIGRDRHDRVLMSIDTDEPRQARTHFEIQQMLPRATLLRVRLETGRTHQIRVHMAAIGHPVCGDPQYGTAGEYGLERQFLHAGRLAFDHPVTGEPMDVSSPLPDDLVAALQAAGAVSPTAA